MSNFSSYSPGVRKDSVRPSGRLASFFVQPGSRSKSESSGPGSLRRPPDPSLSQISEFIPQGKSLHIALKKIPAIPPVIKFEPKLSTNDNDERYQYLMKRAIIRRIEKEDKIIFAELPGLAGVLVVYRSPSERNINPERLNLDRRELSQMPLLEGEERLRLLNYQHNFISKIENLLSLPNLIFLDLYNNQIREINGLQTIPSLRVLMLGKNLIERLKNLNSLIRLDMLDVHSNKITKIENISHLQELRILNLANNFIVAVDNLDGLKALTELNLRKNAVTVVKNLNCLSKLQRVFLSNNCLDRFESVECLVGCTALNELALDGNPIELLSGFAAWVLGKCSRLTHLDLKKVAGDVKDAPKAVVVKIEPILSASLLSKISSEWRNEIERLKIHGMGEIRRKENFNECLIETGHSEVKEGLLSLYGNALETLSKSELYESIHTIVFQYIKFDHIIHISCLEKLKRFQNLRKVLFNDNNIHSCIRLSKLEPLDKLSSISISKNDVNLTVLCRSFIVYRFPGLQEIDDQGVNDEDRSQARQLFDLFDKVLCRNTILKPAMHSEDREVQKMFRATSKRNSEFSIGYVKKIVEHTLNIEARIRMYDNIWPKLADDILSTTTLELATSSALTEEL